MQRIRGKFRLEGTSEGRVLKPNPEVSKLLLFYKFVLWFKCCYAVKFYKIGLGKTTEDNLLL